MRLRKTLKIGVIGKLSVMIILIFAGLINLYGQSNTIGTISGNSTPDIDATESYDFSAVGWTPESGVGTVNATGNECNITESNGDGTSDLVVQWIANKGTINSCNGSTASVTWDDGGTGSLTYFQADQAFWIGSLGVTVIECDFADPMLPVTDIESGVIDIYTDLGFTIVPIDGNGCATGAPLTEITVANRGGFTPILDGDRQYEIDCDAGGTSLGHKSASTTADINSFNIPPGAYGIEWECDGNPVYWIINVTQCTAGDDPVATFTPSLPSDDCIGEDQTFTTDISSAKWSQYIFEWTITEPGEPDDVRGGSANPNLGSIPVTRTINNKTITLKVTTADMDPCTGTTLSSTSDLVTLSAGTAFTTLSNALTVSDLTTLPSGCAGSTVTITASESRDGVSYNWGGDGFVSSTGNSAVVTRGMSVTLNVTSTDACVNESGEATYNIPEGTAYTTLSNSLTVADLTSLPAGCAGSTVTISASESATGADYSWSGDGLVSSTGNSAVVTRGMSVTLEVTSTTSCVNGSGVATYNIPEGTAYTTLSNLLSTDLTSLPAGCAGSTVTISASESATGADYSWSGDGLVSSTGNSAVVTRGMSVTLEVTSTTSCVNGSGVATYNIPEGTAYTTLSNLLSTDLTSLPAGCAGSTVTISASESATGADYSWSGDGLVSSTGSSAVVTRGMSVILEVTSTTSCVNGSGEATYDIPEGTAYTTLSNSLSTDLTSLPSGCAGSTVTISASESATGADYSWSGDGLVSSTGNSAVVTRGMSVTLEVTSTTSCVNGSGVATFNVPEGIPILTTSASISINASETVCEGTTVRFTANHENFSSPSFLWSNDATTSYIDKVVNANETITVTITEGDAGACVDEPERTASFAISIYDPSVVTAPDYHYCSEDLDNNPIEGVTSMTISGIETGFTYYIEAPTRVDASATGEFIGTFPAATYDVYAYAEDCTPEIVGAINVTKTDPPMEVIEVENGTVTDACFNAAELHADENGTGFQWYRDDEELEGETNDFYDLTANDIGNHTYKVTYQVVEGTCTFSQEASLDVVVIEPDRPAVNVEVVGHETRICSGESRVFSGSLSQISGGTYTWWKIEGEVETIVETNSVIITDGQASVPDVSIVIDEDTEIKLVISNIDGCVTNSEVSYSLFMEVKEVTQRVNQVLTYCKYTSGLDLVLSGDDLDTEYALYVESPAGSENYSFVSFSAPRTVENPELRFGMQVQGNYQLTAETTCNEDVILFLTFTIQESITPCLNYTTTQGHDESGLFGESREFFDLTGDAIQTNVRNLSEGLSLVNQVKYDYLDRPGLQTLPAPVLDLGLDYFPEFVEVDGILPWQRSFTHDKWDKEDPDVLSTAIDNPLGWYYSEANNELEPSTDISDHPYSRTFYFDDGTGEIRSSSAAGDPFIVNEDRRTYSKGFPVNYELDDDYLSIREILLNYTDGPSLAGETVKTVTRDANGLESVSFQDSRGNVLVSALSNLTDANAVEWETDFAEDGTYYEVLDFHVPQNGTPLTVSLGEGGNIIDLKNDDGVSDFAQVDKGFYRLTNGSLSYTLKYYNPSFNFYDDKGRMILSIPPNGVNAILDGFDYTSEIDNIPFATYYEYDFQGRLISTREPDHKIVDDPSTPENEALIASETLFVYRKDGNIKFSQNALQRLQDPKTFSYTNYDYLGRPIESGEYVGIISESYPNGLDFSDDTQVALLNPYLESTSADGGFLDSWPHDRNDWVRSYYDLSDANTGSDYSLPRDIELLEYDTRQSNLKVIGTLKLKEGFSINAAEGTFHAKALSEEDLPSIDLPYEQDFVYGAISYTENEHVKTWYNYDEQSRVTEMSTWFKETDEAKSIRYEYDFIGNVTYVAYQEDYLLPDGTPVDNNDSFFHRYFYDDDNRLSKVYAAPLAIDADTPDPLDLQTTYDYYIHGPLKRVELGGNLQGIDYVYNLNGQLKAINDPANSADLAGFADDAFAQIYEYYDNDYSRPGAFSNSNPTHDNYNGNIAAIDWNLIKNGTNQTGKYQYDYDDRYFLKSAIFNQAETYKVGSLTYDSNGNIKTLLRKQETGVVEPGFDGSAGQYSYNDGTNQLQSVNNYASYEYDAIGQMIRQEHLDGSGEIMKSVYDVTGKVVKILDGNNETKITYDYDDRGFRIRSIDHASNSAETFYARDASGQLLAIYEKVGDAYVLKETPIYGAGRLGNYFSTGSITQYELKDHLGNVRALINKQNRDADYIASYYPFGSLMKPVTGTNGQPGRFGYQGDFAEQDPETGLNYFELRFYDSKIGRWLTVDPAREFSSPYLGMGNNPNLSDPTGGCIGPCPYEFMRSLYNSFFGGITSLHSSFQSHAQLTIAKSNQAAIYDYAIENPDVLAPQDVQANFQAAENMVAIQTSFAFTELAYNSLNIGSLAYFGGGAIASGLRLSFSSVQIGNSVRSGVLSTYIRTGSLRGASRSAATETVFYGPRTVTRAPAGGVTINGTRYLGGQYTPRVPYNAGVRSLNFRPSLAPISSDPWPTTTVSGFWRLAWPTLGGLAAYYTYKDHMKNGIRRP